ncbi:hypothetical protein D3C85_1552300 [compost metagenome]
MERLHIVLKHEIGIRAYRQPTWWISIFSFVSNWGGVGETDIGNTEFTCIATPWLVQVRKQIASAAEGVMHIAVDNRQPLNGWFHGLFPPSFQSQYG